MQVVGLIRKMLVVACLVGTGFAFASVTPGGGGGSSTSTVTPTAQAVAATATVHEPWDGLIDVDVTVYLPLSGTTAALSVTATEEGGARTFTAQSLTGATLVPSSGVYRVTWDFAADYPDTFVPSLRVTASAAVASFTPDAISGNYLVVDLSAGAEAESYPVHYLLEAPATGWSDVEKTTQLVLRKIPAGTFTMGTHATDFPTAQDQNLHEVTLTNALWTGVFEVTQRQWELVTGTRPSNFKNDDVYETRPVEHVNYNTIRGSSTEVAATSFLGLLRGRAGDLAFDLPTEAEWEYACRAGTTTGLNSGTNLTSSPTDAALDALARYGQTGSAPLWTVGVDEGTAPVGSYTPNAWGLYDMHGNVWEWTRDWSSASLGSTSVTNPVGPATGTKRVLRGGGWNSGATACTAGYRAQAASPSVSSQSSAYGLRVFATVPAAPVWTGPTTGSGVAEPVFYDGRIIVTLSEALDARELVFTTGGDNGAVWLATNEVVKAGTHAAQCLSPGTTYPTRTNPFPDPTTVWMETTVTGGGTLTFWWKVDCDYDVTGACDWDHLAYFVDGVEQARIDGDTDWAFCTVTLTGEGPHTIRWVYQKDMYDDERVNADTAWVDSVVWTPEGGDDESVTATIAVGADGQVVVGWEPLSSSSARTYHLLAKRKLDDPEWEDVATSSGSFFTAPAGYFFFKIAVSAATERGPPRKQTLRFLFTP